MAKLFFSYSHVDEKLRDRLEKHLKLLMREGLIEVWHDRRILPGDKFGDAISDELEAADIVLLLISADFIASEYCFSIEMKRALERDASGEARVIPVILRMCDWKTADFASLTAVPRDGRAVESWPNQDEAFTEVAREIRRVVTPAGGSKKGPAPVAQMGSAAPVVAAEPLPRSSNLRVKKEFTDLEKDTFVADAFKFFGLFFQGSLEELGKRNPEYVGRFEQVDSRRFRASIYKDGKSAAECQIALGGWGRGSTQITYAEGSSMYSNGFNEALSVESDSQELYLKVMMGAIMRGASTEHLSPSGAAEYLWSMLIERLR